MRDKLEVGVAGHKFTGFKEGKEVPPNFCITAEAQPAVGSTPLLCGVCIRKPLLES